MAYNKIWMGPGWPNKTFCPGQLCSVCLYDLDFYPSNVGSIVSGRWARIQENNRDEKSKKKKKNLETKKRLSL